MKFLADRGISPRVVTALRKQGHDAVHLQEQNLGRLLDGAILAKARAEGRILLTHDLDFGELLAASGGILPSVIIFRLKDMRAEIARAGHIQEVADRPASFCVQRRLPV